MRPARLSHVARLSMAALLAVAVSAGCSGSRDASPSPTAPPRPTASTPADVEPSHTAPAPTPTGTRPVAHPTLWLCRPGLADNPCEGGLDATAIGPDGTRTVQAFSPADDPVADCFYVYPTVSEARTDSAPLEVTDAEAYVVRAQAARFAATCRVFAPIYRQITRSGLVGGALASEQARELAYGDVLSAFNDYLNRDNDGRPFVLVGHSQGALTLTRLIQQEIDGDPQLRQRLLSAVLLGTSVTTRPDEPDGGTFANIPACESDEQSGCVVSYVTYPGRPPSNGIFGRSTEDRRALCVSPAELLGRGEQLAAYLPTAALVGDEPLVEEAPETGFVTFPDAIAGRCRTTAEFGWLDVTIDRRLTAQLPQLGGDRDPAWGLHRADVSLALGDLVDLVAAQADAWAGRGGLPSEP